jgi:hypothetical protein
LEKPFDAGRPPKNIFPSKIPISPASRAHSLKEGNRKGFRPLSLTLNKN